MCVCVCVYSSRIHYSRVHCTWLTPWLNSFCGHWGSSLSHLLLRLLVLLWPGPQRCRLTAPPGSRRSWHPQDTMGRRWAPLGLVLSCLCWASGRPGEPELRLPWQWCDWVLFVLLSFFCLLPSVILQTDPYTGLCHRLCFQGRLGLTDVYFVTMFLQS